MTLEARRKNAISCFLKGCDDRSNNNNLSEADVARKFGVTRGAVWQWLETYRKSGNQLEGLNAREHTGRPPRMTRQQKRRLAKMIEKGAKNHGFETDLWTTNRIARLIEEQFKIKYHRDHVRKLLRSLNLSWRNRDAGELPLPYSRW